MEKNKFCWTSIALAPLSSQTIDRTRQLRLKPKHLVDHVTVCLLPEGITNALGAARGLQKGDMGMSGPTRVEERREEEWGSWSAEVGWSGPAGGEQSRPHAAAPVMDVERAARDVVHVSCMLPPHRHYPPVTSCCVGAYFL